MYPRQLDTLTQRKLDTLSHIYGKYDTLSQTARAQKPYPIRPHVPVYLIWGSNPPGAKLRHFDLDTVEVEFLHSK